MQLQTKNLSVTEMEDTGKGLALLANLSEVDHDGDGYEKGAFNWAGDQWVPLIAGHDRSKMQFGKARIFEDGDNVYAELHFNLDTQAGKEWRSALQFDLKTGVPVQEWSYGYRPLKFEKVFRDGRPGRVLKQVKAHEVSTVIIGAGLGTQTIDIKGLKAALKEGEFKSLIEQLGTMASVLEADQTKLSETGRKQLTEIHGSLGAALVHGDPELEAKAIAEIDQIHANLIAGDAIRAAERHIAT